MKIYAFLDYETLVRKRWIIEKFISTCKALHVEIIKYRYKKRDTSALKESLSDLARLSFKPVVAIGATYAVVGSDLYEY